MIKDYFELQHEKNKQGLINLLKVILEGLISINTLTIQKNMTGGYRLIMFFKRKDE